MQLAQENTTRRSLDLTDHVNDKLARTLEIAEHSNIAFEQLKEEIARQGNMGVSFWRYLELAGTCKLSRDWGGKQLTVILLQSYRTSPHRRSWLSKLSPSFLQSHY